MSRKLVTLLLLCIAAPVWGAIRVEQMSTYDTGVRLLNGQWRIGSDVEMDFIDNSGRPTTVTWRTQHWIHAANGETLVTSGWQEIVSGTYASTVAGYGGFQACYRGRAYASVGDVVREVGGGEVCTSARPIYPDYCESHPTAEECGFDPTCPILVNLENGPWVLAGAADRVHFDMDADGEAEPLSWTAAGSSLAFLVWDRNRNGTIDDGTELFGNATPVAGGKAGNGFVALSALDDNGDHVIDSSDGIWSSLRLWTDRNHDAVSQPAELVSVTGSPLLALELGYHWTARADQHGNTFRYQALAKFARGTRPYYDVYFIRFR